MFAFCFDFETYEIANGIPHPPAICMSFAIVDMRSLSIVNWGVLGWRDGIAALEHAIAQGWYMVGAHTAFDVFVSVANAPDVLASMHRWIAVAKAARLTDVLLRQRLLDGAVDKWQRLQKYSLAAVYKHWSGRALDKNESIRLRFDTLDGAPVDQYPCEFYDYALGDAVATAWVFICQEYALRGRVSEHNGVNYRVRFPTHDILCDQHRQQMKALALEDLSATGLRTDGATVEKFARQLEDEKARLLKTLVPYGLVRCEYELNRAAIVRRFESLGIIVPRLASGAASLTKAQYGQIRGRDPELAATQRINGVHSWPDTAPELAARGSELVTVTHVKNEDRARFAVELVYECGTTFDATTGKIVTLEDGETPNRSEKRDLATRKIVYGDVKVDADNCDRSGHTALAAYAQYASVVKTLGSDIELMRRAASEPFHAHYTVMKENGRTATGSEGGEGTAGNVQNMPRLPGVRECWWAPLGWLFSGADYEAVELSTFGQVCLWWVGWSECARMIKDGVDQHCVMGAALADMPDPKGASWKEVKKRKKDGDAKADELRTGGKGMNFGCKARMSAPRYQKYAWNNYGLKLTIAGAQRCIDLHNQVIAEMAPYTTKLQSFCRDPGKFGALYDLVHPWSGRVRAGLKYTDVHNYPFSGLAQDLAAVALWDLFCASWGASELGLADPLFNGGLATRCRLVLFVHDDIVMLVPDEPVAANAAAKRQGEIMTRAGLKVLPDVGCKAEANLMRQLSKKSGDPSYDDNGQIKVFDAWQACRDDAANEKRPADKTVRQWLLDRDWPPYMVNDVIGEER